MTFKISAFLFAGLIFFVTFLHQGKKVKAFYFEGNFRTKYLTFVFPKAIRMRYLSFDKLSDNSSSFNFYQKLNQVEAYQF